jgi:hypothetical protein
MAGNNELDRPLLGLLDENIAAAAATNNQVGDILQYIFPRGSFLCIESLCLEHMYELNMSIEWLWVPWNVRL